METKQISKDEYEDNFICKLNFDHTRIVVVSHTRPLVPYNQVEIEANLFFVEGGEVFVYVDKELLNRFFIHHIIKDDEKDELLARYHKWIEQELQKDPRKDLCLEGLL